MKRFLIFAYERYYPGGGFNDFKISVDTIEEVHEYAIKSQEDYVDYFDTLKSEYYEDCSESTRNGFTPEQIWRLDFSIVNGRKISK